MIGPVSSGVRTKRYVEDIDRSSFKQFAIPAIGVEVGIKFHDPPNFVDGDEAYLEVQDLQSLMPQAKIKAVALHARINATKPNQTFADTHLTVDYHFEHTDGSGVEKGSIEIKQIYTKRFDWSQKRHGRWQIVTEALPFSGTSIIPIWINDMNFVMNFVMNTVGFEKVRGKYVNVNMGHDITYDIEYPIEYYKLNPEGPSRFVKAVITSLGMKNTIDVAFGRNSSATNPFVIITAVIRGIKYDGEISVNFDSFMIDFKQGSQNVFELRLGIGGLHRRRSPGKNLWRIVPVLVNPGTWPMVLLAWALVPLFRSSSKAGKDPYSSGVKLEWRVRTLDSMIEGSFNRSGQDMDFIVTTDCPDRNGKISVKRASDMAQFGIEFGQRGGISLLELMIGVWVTEADWSAEAKYAVHGGAAVKGDLKATYTNNLLILEVKSFEDPRDPEKIEKYKLQWDQSGVGDYFNRAIAMAFVNERSVWTHETQPPRINQTPVATFVNFSSRASLNDPVLHKYIQNRDPMGVFQTRVKETDMFFDKNNSDPLFPGFRIKQFVVKDGEKIKAGIWVNGVDLPYQVSFYAPDLSRSLDIPPNWITVTVNDLEHSEEKTKAECLVEYFVFKDGGGVDQRNLSISFDSTSLPWISLRKTKIEVISSGDQLLRTEVTLRGTTSKGEFQGWYEVSGRSKKIFKGEFDKAFTSYTYPARLQFAGSWLEFQVIRKINQTLTVIIPAITEDQAPFSFEINSRDVNQVITQTSEVLANALSGIAKAGTFLMVNQHLLEQWWFEKFFRDFLTENGSGGNIKHAG